MDAREYLKGLLYSKRDIDDWLAGRAFTFASYDSKLGYIHRARRTMDGINNSVSTYTYDPATRSRRLINHAERECRINTYGDSFTHCDQVSDGETWQERLAAHLGEPIRNFGVGAYSVYQMYLRMITEEERFPARYIIMNIYDDDHQRSMIPLQHMRSEVGPDHFHPPIPHLIANPHKEEFAEFANPAPRPEDLYNFCDLDYTYEKFKGNFGLRIMLAKRNARIGSPQDSYRDIEDLAEEFGKPTRIRTATGLLQVANDLFARAATYASERVVQNAKAFARRKGKKILFVTSYGPSPVAERLKPGSAMTVPEKRRPGFSYNHEFTRSMKMSGLPWIDLVEAHKKDFAGWKLGLPDYLARYYVHADRFATHYSPMGNFFLAAAVRKDLVEMLNPKPASYSRAGLEYDRSAPL
jgi:hypothetical protein